MFNWNSLPVVRMLSNTDAALIVIIGGLLNSPIWVFIKQNGFKTDVVFLFCLGILLLIDFVTGVTKGIKLKELSSGKMKNTPIKMLIYLALFIGIFVVGYFISQMDNSVAFWLKSAIYSAILITELLSITENVAALSQLLLKRNIVPVVMLKYLRDFDENGIFKGLDNIRNEARNTGKSN